MGECPVKNKTNEKKEKGWGSRFLAWIIKGRENSSVPLCGQ